MWQHDEITSEQSKCEHNIDRQPQHPTPTFIRAVRCTAAKFVKMPCKERVKLRRKKKDYTVDGRGKCDKTLVQN